MQINSQTFKNMRSQTQVFALEALLEGLLETLFPRGQGILEQTLNIH